MKLYIWENQRKGYDMTEKFNVSENSDIYTSKTGYGLKSNIKNKIWKIMGK